ncbi:YhhA family cyclophane-containing RiPP [Bradyrhizobium sp. SZCCHNRI1073]|uniref:YhhA family cyclophane-containing RiPP n=1 Tax=Bradyrhizobium sp. SZCCHNRI1073 TaxID=3057280 RepID=UPI00291658F9|nr:YhhA family cyclophane-containing RiPP [Bradyrhizobium sp. SZCCHNRI1073]
MSNIESVASETTDLRNSVLRSEPTNAAVQRLQKRVLQSAEASEVITSYDRMHHRHNRT